MARIKHPRFQPGRTKALGLEFIDGYADVDLTDAPILHQALLQHGYEIRTLIDSPAYGLGIQVDFPTVVAEGNQTVTGTVTFTGPSVESGVTVTLDHDGPPLAPLPLPDVRFLDLTTLKLADLRDIADIEGIDHPAKATRAQLIDLLSRAPAKPIQFAVVELPDGTVIGDGKSIATLHAADEG